MLDNFDDIKKIERELDELSDEINSELARTKETADKKRIYSKKNKKSL